MGTGLAISNLLQSEPFIHYIQYLLAISESNQLGVGVVSFPTFKPLLAPVRIPPLAWGLGFQALTDYRMSQPSSTYLEYKNQIRAQFHGSAYRRILRLRWQIPAYVQALNFCASLVSAECLVTWSTHAQNPKFAANLWKTLDVSTEFPASVSADSVLTVSRAMKLGTGCGWCGFFHCLLSQWTLVQIPPQTWSHLGFSVHSLHNSPRGQQYTVYFL